MLLKHIFIPNELWNNIYQTGSSVICDPPVTDTDIDYVIYAKDDIPLLNWLEKNGFTCSTEDAEEYDLQVEGGMKCLRNGKVNLIVVDNYNFYLRWVRATNLAKQLNLLKKEDRITLFQAILYP